MKPYVFQVFGPDGTVLEMYRDDDGVYVIRKSRLGVDGNVFIASSSTKDYAVDLFKNEVYKMLVYWKQEIDG